MRSVDNEHESDITNDTLTFSYPIILEYSSYKEL
jgi:hypothetical protein